MTTRFLRIPDGWWCIGLLAIHAAMLAWSAARLSPTIDEPAHLVAGLSYWKTGRFDLYCVNPPLPPLIGALPVVLTQPVWDETPIEEHLIGRPEFALGRRFLAENGERSLTLMMIARWACVSFSLMGALGCYFWARELYGRAAGFLAMGLWCPFPEVLAHGAVMTPDMPAAATGVWAGFLFWKWLRNPTWKVGAIAGLLLGVALLSKTTWLILLGIWPILWLGFRLTSWREMTARRWTEEGGQLASSLAIGLVVVNAGYLFQGSFQPLGEYEFLSGALSGGPPRNEAEWQPGNRFRGSFVGALPVPLPAPLIRGLDLQKSDFEVYRPAYLRGRLCHPLPWWFYEYAALVKWPLGFWLLLWMSLLSKRSVSRRDLVALLAPALAIILLTMHEGTPGYLRYLLPAMSFLIVWCSGLARNLAGGSLRYSLPVIGAMAWLAAGSLYVYPYSLSYFNEIAGGPSNGASHLLDCNIDWGQDLYELKRWLDGHPEAGTIHLAYHGSVDPRLAGIDFHSIEPPDGAAEKDWRPAPGWYAISAHALRGGFSDIYDEQGGFRVAVVPSLAVFQRFRPIARAGYSILIFRIEMTDDN
jgi:hypothetical protein